MAKARFDWDQDKDEKNHRKHGVSFALAQLAFVDPQRVIAEDCLTVPASAGTSASAR